MSPTSNPDRKTIIAAQMEGYRAYLAGQSAKENPQPWDEPDRRQGWYRGYAAARTDRARANRAANSDQ